MPNGPRRLDFAHPLLIYPLPFTILETVGIIGRATTSPPPNHHLHAQLCIWFVLIMGPTTWSAHIEWTHEAHRGATTWHPLVFVLKVKHVTVLPKRKLCVAIPQVTGNWNCLHLNNYVLWPTLDHTHPEMGWIPNP